MATDGSNPMRLTDSPGQDVEAVWSPDGTMIAFMSPREGNHEVFLMGRDGSDPINVSNHPLGDGSPQWGR
jgi:TolB protein